MWDERGWRKESSGKTKNWNLFFSRRLLPIGYCFRSPYGAHTQRFFFSHDWLAVVQIHGFCILFPFPPPLLLRARICTHTYTMKTVSHPPGAEILTHMTVPLLSMCNFAGIALVWLHFSRFSCTQKTEGKLLVWWNLPCTTK